MTTTLIDVRATLADDEYRTEGRGKVSGEAVDPNLISIPKYIGLASKSNTRACRILSISGAPSGVYRYRLVTFANDDLVFDIIKTKTQWAIKAIYIAPADIVWQRIAHHMMDSSETQGDSIAMPSSP